MSAACAIVLTSLLFDHSPGLSFLAVAQRLTCRVSFLPRCVSLLFLLLPNCLVRIAAARKSVLVCRR